MKPKLLASNEGSSFSFQASCPSINGVTQKMELVILIEQEDKEDVILTFNRNQTKELMKELKDRTKPQL